ncbi:hypothetical protein VST7929_03193 [Vibrio stylophorae]|uniref:DUF3069 domain-containing protein n=1 Tax=Vibrio stylophorae TaxID=659351 RepID=A0ABM8ZXY5_9VIBR|nr:DUF3069 domain-containing protein [Vibrio stylophorae]CAH0535716.1 hypothetical protein VST7929_03193 [Vibrio stylophorae]
MSDKIETETVKLEELAKELRQVIDFEGLHPELIPVVASIHEANAEDTKLLWESLPQSAQLILDNFDQFHALIAFAQGVSSIEVIQELQKVDFPEDMDEQARSDYRDDILSRSLHASAKDLCKQLKKARLKPEMKREFRKIFA